jgi:hypothetical protein
MSYQRTAAPSSRVNKSASKKKNSPFQTTKRRKPSVSATARLKRVIEADDTASELDDYGRLESPEVLRVRIAPGLSSSDIVDIMRYFQSHMFSDIPNRAPGMNSTRIAEVLNYRLQLPPIIPIAHLHALRSSPTSTEREIVSKVQAGVLRKVTIPGRGLGATAIGEVLILVSEWENLVHESSSLSDALKEKYIAYLNRKPTPVFKPDDLKALSRAGLLTARSTAPSISNTFLQPGSTSIGTLAYVADAGSRHASGTDAAVATSSVEHLTGGSGAQTRLQPGVFGGVVSQLPYNLSLPNTGPYLRLISAARGYMLGLLAKSGPRKSMPLERLRERWDGGTIDSDANAHLDKPVRGVLPGRTKKWREFYGLRFEWVISECIGAGLVECFRTGSVGTGVRAI